MHVVVFLGLVPADWWAEQCPGVIGCRTLRVLELVWSAGGWVLPVGSGVP